MRAEGSCKGSWSRDFCVSGFQDVGLLVSGCFAFGNLPELNAEFGFEVEAKGL